MSASSSFYWKRCSFVCAIKLKSSHDTINLNPNDVFVLDVCSTPIGTFQDSKKNLADGAGVWIDINRTETDLKISSTINTRQIVYARLIYPRIYVSINIELLIKLTACEIDIDATMNGLMQPQDYSFRTSWVNTYAIPPGGQILLKSCGEEKKLNFQFAYPQIDKSDKKLDLADAFIESIQDYSNLCSTAVVNFSGGTDSTAILYGLREVRNPKDIVAMTWCSDGGSSPFDTEISSSIAKYLGVKHIIKRFRPKDLVLSPTLPVLYPLPSTAAAFCGVYERLAHEISESYAGKVGVFDGHGGDHLFLDPVPPGILRQIFSDYGFRVALRKLNDLSSLTTTGFPVILLSELFINNMETDRRSIELFSRDALWKWKNSNCFPIKDVHQRNLLQAIYQNSFQRVDRVKYARYYPFTSARMMAAARSWPVEEFFDAKNRRVPFRKAMRARYPDITFRDEKGDITGAFQRAICLHSKDLFLLIQNGYLSRLGLLNLDKVAEQIRRASTGVDGVSEILLRITSFERMLNHIKKLNVGF